MRERDWEKNEREGGDKRDGNEKERAIESLRDIDDERDRDERRKKTKIRKRERRRTRWEESKDSYAEEKAKEELAREKKTVSGIKNKNKK